MVDFNELVAPSRTWSLQSPDELAQQLEEHVRAVQGALEDEDAARPVAVAVVVAYGNYEWASGRKSDVIVAKANALMQELEPQQSRRWG